MDHGFNLLTYFRVQRGSSGDWGQKANNVLRFTKGKSFRHEKTKKKRGSYVGGPSPKLSTPSSSTVTELGWVQ